MKKPLISVITVVRNGAGTVRETIASVLEQDYPNLQYIVVDGASTDGTTAILQSFGDRICWVSEPDDGIYDAINKGVALARGDWLYFLGADDRLSGPGVLSAVSRYLDDSLALAFGTIRYPDGRRVKSSLGPRTLLHNTVHHQGAFYNARLFSQWRYDSVLRIVADYELNLLLHLRGEPYRRMDEQIALCGDLGVSVTRWREAVRETDAVRARHTGTLLNAACSALNALEMALYRLVLSIKGCRTA